MNFTVSASPSPASDSFNLHEFAIFSAIVTPLSLIVGLASATIGFTSWTIIVPLLISKLFDFELFNSIFIAMCMDSVNGMYLTAFYARKGHVRFRLASALSMLALVVAVPCVFVAGFLLKKYEYLLKGGVGYASFLVGLLFLVKAGLEWRKSKKEARENQLISSTSIGIDEEARLLNGKKRSPVEPESDEGASAAFNDHLAQRRIEEMIDHISEDDEGAAASVTPGLPSALGGSDVSDGAEDRPLLVTDEAQLAAGGINTDIGDAASSERAARRKQRRTKRQAKLKAQDGWTPRSRAFRHVMTVFFTLFTGAMSGLLGVGGGTNFATLLHFAQEWPLIESTASGCFCMAFMMSGIIASYVAGAGDINSLYLNFPFYYPYLLVSVGAGLLGTILGSAFASRMSQTTLTFTVAFCLISMGVLQTVQGIVLKHENHGIFN